MPSITSYLTLPERVLLKGYLSLLSACVVVVVVLTSIIMTFAVFLFHAPRLVSLAAVSSGNVDFGGGKAWVGIGHM